MADQQDKLTQQSKKREAQVKKIKQVRNDYKKWEGTVSYKDLNDWLEDEAKNLMRDVKNRYSVVNGQLAPLDDGMVLSLLYKSAGLDMVRQYIKNKLD